MVMRTKPAPYSILGTYSTQGGQTVVLFSTNFIAKTSLTPNPCAQWRPFQPSQFLLWLIPTESALHNAPRKNPWDELYEALLATRASGAH